MTSSRHGSVPVYPNRKNGESMLTRLLVVSDSHGDRRTLRRILERHPDATCVFHLGDGAADMEALAEEIPGLTAHIVCGNCDSAFRLFPQEQWITVADQTVWAIHGHTYGVKSSPLRYQLAARQRGATIALFGHTHQPLLHQEEGLCLMNPGSVRDGGHYALLDIVDGHLFPHPERLS